MVKKITSVSLALSVALSMFVFSVGVSHAEQTWRWREIEVTPHVYTEIPYDNRCDDPDRAFKVTLYTEPNFGGRRAVVCGRWDDLERLPQWKGSSLTFNNSVSSYRVLDLPSATSEGVYGVRFSFLKNQEGTFWVRGSGYHNEGGGDVDNKMSSLRRIFVPY
jgi:hypothetical protein